MLFSNFWLSTDMGMQHSMNTFQHCCDADVVAAKCVHSWYSRMLFTVLCALDYWGQSSRLVRVMMLGRYANQSFSAVGCSACASPDDFVDASLVDGRIAFWTKEENRWMVSVI